ncbi:AMP-binding protein [Streptomyces sp. NPDC059134]|uniref:AMP-binding protein n=1 Tax=Streptomyces sp. NPDC059134 TaxID=3346738 RepID=UPI0036AF7033
MPHADHTGHTGRSGHIGRSGGADRSDREAAAVAALSAPGAPFATVRTETGSLVYADGPRTLREFVEPTWAYGDRPFLLGAGPAAVDPDPYTYTYTYTYGEFFAAATALANHFVDAYGLRPGDRAALVMGDRPAWQAAFWAAQLAGLVAVPLDAGWTEDLLAYALDDCAPRVLLVDGERLPRVRRWAARQGPGAVRTVVGHHRGELDAGAERYEDLPAPDRYAAPPDVEVRAEDDATISYVPGPSGRPRGAVATHLAQAGAAMNARYLAAVAALGRGEIPGLGSVPVTPLTSPFPYAGTSARVYAAMAAGGALRVPDGPPHDTGSGSGAASGSGSGSASGAGSGSGSGPGETFGLTETCGDVLAGGRPTPVTEVRIDEAGELWLRGQSLVRGYWGEAPLGEGWFGTGVPATLHDGRVRTGSPAP